MKSPVTKLKWVKKVWGRTAAVTVGHGFEVHTLNVNQNGYCSIHRHKKFNQFQVLTGRLQIENWGDDGLDPYDDNFDTSCYQLGQDQIATVLILEPGQRINISPGHWHRFTALTDCTLLEVYWMPAIDVNDIERAMEGGMLP